MDESYYRYIRGWFWKWAWFYNFIALPLTGIRNKVAGMIDSKDKIKILDVCTGIGTQAFAFAKRGYEVMGIDLSEEMLRVANKKNKYENVRFVVADAAKMPFENDYFDCACISFGLHDMPHEVRHRIGIYEVFLERSVRKIWVRGEPSPEPYIPCYTPRRPKGGERSVARSEAEST